MSKVMCSVLKEKKSYFFILMLFYALVAITTITTVHAAQCTPPPSGMVSWWGGDNNTLDMVGGNNGTLMNGATYATGMVGQAFSLDGVNQFIEVPDSPGLHVPTAVTLDAWINTADPSKGQAIVWKSQNVGNWASYFLTIGGGKMGFEIDNWSTGTYGGWLADFNPSANTWYHVAVTWQNVYGDERDATIYINGVPQTTQLVYNQGYNSSFALYYTSFPLYIGQDEARSRAFNGLIDEVEIFDRVLSAGEIAAIYNAGSEGKCRSCTEPLSGMVSWWTGNGNSNDIIGGSNGTLMNGATYAPGFVGQAFRFDGVDDYIDLPDGFADFTSGLTVGLWANPTASGYWARFIDLGNGPFNNNILFDRRSTSNDLAFEVYDGGVSAGMAYAVNAITNNEWHYYAATMDATGKVQLYKDGLALVMAANITRVPNNVTRVNNYIGKSNMVLSGDAHYAGSIDEVQIYNRALTAGEIAAIYNARSAGQCIPLVASADLSVTKTDSPDPVVVGNNITYTITIMNNGPDTATGVTLTDNFPLSALFVSANSTQGSCGKSMGMPQVICDLGDIGNGGTVTVTIVMTANTVGTITNTATVASGTTDPDTSNNTATADTTVQSTLTVNINPASGGTVTGTGINCPGDCTETYSSSGNVTLTANQNTGYSFTSWTGCNSTSGNQCTVSTSQNRNVVANFARNRYTVTPSAGANGSINPNIQQTVTHGNTIQFTVSPDNGYSASVGGSCGGTLVGNAYTTYPITANCTVAATFVLVTPMPDLVVSSVYGPSSGVALGMISVTVTIKNQGTAPLSLSRLSPRLSPVVAKLYLSSDTVITTGDIEIGQISILSLAPGESTTSTVPVMIPNITQGNYYIGAVVDPANRVTEHKENNNTGYCATPINIKPAGPPPPRP